MPAEETVVPTVPEEEAAPETSETSSKSEELETSQPPKQDDDSEYSEKVRKRIAKETYHRREAERQRDEALRKFNEIQSSSKPSQNADAGDPEPKFPDESTYTGPDAYERLRADERKAYKDHSLWAARQVLRQSKEADQQQAATEKIQKSWSAAEAKAIEKHDDYQEVFNYVHSFLQGRPTPTSKSIATTLMESEVGPEITYFLGQRPEECERLMTLSPHRASAEIGKIEDAVIAASKPATDDSKKEEEQASPVAQTKAPRPAVPVNRPRAVNNDLSDSEPYPDWLRKRDGQVKARRGY